jgi:hypothetical protein
MVTLVPAEPLVGVNEVIFFLFRGLDHVRTGGSDGLVTVDYTTEDSTATSGADYDASVGTLYFDDNVTSQTFTVAIYDDAEYEGDEELSLFLSNPTSGATLDTLAADLIIRDDEEAQNLNQ